MKWAIGIDIGGTKIAAGLVDLKTGRLLSKCRFPTNPSRGGKAVLETVLGVVCELCKVGERRRAKPERIGVGLPELVGPTGKLITDAMFRWTELQAHKKLDAILPTFFEADVRAAARAEAWFGAGIGLKTFLYVTIGTGISCSLVINGEPFLGAHGRTGTFASAPTLVTMPDGGLFSGMPLEHFASGSAIARRHKLGDAEKIFRRAAKGHVDAAEIATTSGIAVGAAIAALVNTLDPEVVIGGGLGLTEETHFHRALKHGFRKHVWFPLHAEVPLVSAKLGPNAGIIGAALATRTQ